MAEVPAAVERLHTYCALCVSRCGAIATLEASRFVSLEPDPGHPTGKALCAKGRAAPELVYHKERLRYPMKRTKPKDAGDPGWQRISWDEALETTATRLQEVAREGGSEGVVFSISSPSTSASDDSMDWFQRLVNAFGSPNLAVSMELCGWGRYLATAYTFGESVPGSYMPDLENAGCILYWGYNPNHARLVHATATVAAQKRGARLIVVDPKQTEPARRADIWLQVRPGTDGALALGIAGIMIARGWYDEDFVRRWTNAPLLVRSGDGRLLRESDISDEGEAGRYVAWDAARSVPVPYDPSTQRYKADVSDLAIFGEYTVETINGPLTCRPAFDHTAGLCRTYTPELVESITGVPAPQVTDAARMIWESRPLAYYAWSGVEMQTNATYIARAIAQLCVLSGSFDSRGGNVLWPSVPASDITSSGLPRRDQQRVSLGFAERPMGPARWGFTTSEELYRGILDRKPYAVRALVTFGSNILLSHSDSARGRAALSALDFYVHTDLFMNPTAELADIVLPVAGAFEREALRMGFEVSEEAKSLVQLRPRIVDPPGEARSDTEIIFALAARLGLGEHFWNGDVDAGLRYQLAPSGITLESLRAEPAGIRVPMHTQYRKFEQEGNGVARGFGTPTKKIELYSETLLSAGYEPLPTYEEPLVGPISRPDLLERFPLVLTCVKHHLFCETQHRSLPSLRRRALDPELELHPSAATKRGIQTGDWVSLVTPLGSVKARALLNESLQPNVVVGQHGWWQACEEIGAPGYDAFGSEGANFNLIIGSDAIDPISGSVPHRAYLCQVRRD